MWPNQENQPNALPDAVEAHVAVEAQQLVIQEEQAAEEVINIAADPLDQMLATQEVIELSNSRVLAMDDGTDASDGEQQEIQAPLLPAEPVNIVPFSDFNQL